MNPGFSNQEEYFKYRDVLKKAKSIGVLDGIDINDTSSFESPEKQKKINLFNFSDENSKNQISNNNNNPYLEPIAEENDENDLNNIIKMKKRQSTITYSQRMLKKADNLTKFNRKNHSEGNKHITNNDL
jgi:hypothetical protein